MNRLASFFKVVNLLEIRSMSVMRITADGKAIPKTKNFENRITLINIDNEVSITDLRNAQSISNRRDLKLVKIQDVDSKTRRPVYKLMTNSEYHEEELEKRKQKQEARKNVVIKGQKLISLSTKIGEHDLITAVNKMLKLLAKQYEVKVVVTGEGIEESQNSERIYSVIEKNVKTSGKIVQKRNKGNALKFQLLPNRDGCSTTSSSDSNGNENNKGPL